MRVEVATETNRPLSEIEACWTDRDLAAHMAMRVRTMRDSEGTCQRCGTRRDGWYTDDGRLAPLPDYLLERSECEGCKRLGLEDVTDEERNYTNMRFQSSELPTSPED